MLGIFILFYVLFFDTVYINIINGLNLMFWKQREMHTIPMWGFFLHPSRKLSDFFKIHIFLKKILFAFHCPESSGTEEDFIC